MFERPGKGERAILVHLNLTNSKTGTAMEEFQELSRSAGALPMAVVTGTRAVPEAKYFIGSGKAQEVKQQVMAMKAELVLIDHNLSPSQQRNLEKLLNCRVIDRSGLILDIFAQRARTFEGKLQVELAQLQHLATRLVRGWTHLERQKGGIGLRGPGETQLETDRRLIKHRIKTIRMRLEKVRSQRQQSRRARERAEIPTISLVGYTNTGKSTLFNFLTHSDVFAANLLFATLDPTLRKVDLPEIGAVIFADTVGFIRNLPHDLIAAFKATLEETREANLLLHVVDVSHQKYPEDIAAVEAVLKEINAQDVPILFVYNKIDQLKEFSPRLDRDTLGKPYRVWISAKTGEGTPLLCDAIIELLQQEMISCTWQLDADEGKLRAKLYRMKAVLAENSLPNGGWELALRLRISDYRKFSDSRRA